MVEGAPRGIPSQLLRNMRGLPDSLFSHLSMLLLWKNLLSLFCITERHSVSELQNDRNMAMVSVSLIGS